MIEILVYIGAIGLPLATAFVAKRRLLAVVWPAWVGATAVLSAVIGPTAVFVPLAVTGALAAALLLLRRTPATPAQLARPQVLRVVGGVFLIAMAQGLLPPAFAIPAGLGDIAVGVAAPFVSGRTGLLWFHALGILDLVVALALGALLQPSTLAATDAPLVLIPATAVPLAIALHVIALRGLLGKRALLFVE